MMTRQLLTLLAALAAVGCTHLEAVTLAPAGRSASVDNRGETIVLSQGVAVAFKCTTAWGNPCDANRASVDDVSIARIYPAHLEELERFTRGTFKPTSYVIVGLKPGSTTLRIEGEHTYRVVVEN
ncbi:MAG: hypothetical protein ACOY0T_11230 [Myxococcota bacterium]